MMRLLRRLLGVTRLEQRLWVCEMQIRLLRDMVRRLLQAQARGQTMLPPPRHSPADEVQRWLNTRPVEGEEGGEARA